MVKNFNSEKLNDIFNELLSAIDKGKNKAFKFHKIILRKINTTEKELKKINKQIEALDIEIKKAAIKFKKYRNKLLKITKAISKQPNLQQSIYAEIYKKTNELMFEVQNMESEYQVLFKERDKLERELINLKELLIDTEDLIQSISTSFEYLNNDLSDISKHLNKKEIMLLKIIEARESEKKIIARDIHDGPAQTLVYLSLEIQILKSLIKYKNTEDIYKKIEEIDRHIHGVLEETRQIIYDLRPMSLDDLGLIPTLKNYIKEFNESKNTCIIFTLIDKKNLASKLPNSLSITVFRIIQEAINNIFKHSGVKTATIKMEFLNNGLRLKVVDNGKGFDVNKVCENANINGGLGLLGMKERVDLTGGEIRINSNKNNGTQIVIFIPWDFQQ